MKIYTDSRTSVDVQVSKGKKWYSYVLPKDKGLHHIGEQEVFDDGNNNIITKVIVKANISYDKDTVFDSMYSVIPNSTVEASFKGSNTSKVTTMYQMFKFCSNLTSLDLSGFDTSNVTSMSEMFQHCTRLTSLDLSGFNTIKVTDMGSMFESCNNLNAIRMVGCTPETITKIEQALTAAGIKDNVKIKTT